MGTNVTHFCKNRSLSPHRQLAKDKHPCDIKHTSDLRLLLVSSISSTNQIPGYYAMNEPKCSSGVVVYKFCEEMARNETYWIKKARESQRANLCLSQIFIQLES